MSQNYKTPPGERDLKRSSGPTFGGKEIQTRLSSALSSYALENPSVGVYHVLGEVVLLNDWFCCKKLISYIMIKTLPAQVTSIPMYLLLLVKRELLSSLQQPFKDLPWMNSPSRSSLLHGEKLISWLSSHRAGSPPLLSSSWSSSGPSPVHVFLEFWDHNAGTVTQVQPDKCWVQWDALVSTCARNALWVQPRIQICHCCCSNSQLT